MIVAFVYDFPHFKSAQGLLALKLAGVGEVVAVAAPWRKLSFQPSTYQFSTANLTDAQHPAEVAAALGMHYLRAPHDDDRVRRLMASAEMGIVLGARVLPPRVVTAGAPIVNIHPGVLPLNRGLDTLKWAVHEDLPQALAVHVIDKRIDRGELLYHEVIDVQPEDSPGDICNRLMWRQIANAGEAVRMLRCHRANPREERALIGKGVYRRPMTLEQDRETRGRFMSWKRRIGEINAAWMQRSGEGELERVSA